MGFELTSLYACIMMFLVFIVRQTDGHYLYVLRVERATIKRGAVERNVLLVIIIPNVNARSSQFFFYDFCAI